VRKLRTITIATLLALVALLAGTSRMPASAATNPPAFGGSLGSCSSTHGATVAVDFGPWAGPVVLGCDPAPTTGIALLHTGGFTTAGDQHDGPQFICRIGHPAFASGSQRPTVAQDACFRTPPASASWSYWLAAAGQNTWTYSQLGTNSDRPGTGEVQAWVYGATDSTDQPRFTPAQVRAARPLALSAAYIASSRSSSAVYVNGLIKQLAGGTWVRSPGRSVYLQRFINGGWQTMLERRSDSTGQLAVGFIQTTPYNYRLYVSPGASTAAATSATTVR
jgi:hypothetical protein